MNNSGIEKTAVAKGNKVDKLSETDMISFYKDIVQTGGNMKRLTNRYAERIYNYNLPQGSRINDFEQLYDKDGKPAYVYFSRVNNISVTQQELMRKYDNIVAGLSLDKGKYIISRLICWGGQIRQTNTPTAIIKYVLSTTKKPIKYTYGLAYRNPTTKNVPISSEQALKCLSRKMCDVTEYADYISVNEYSSNDML